MIFERLARAHVAGFAAIYDVRLGDVDLDDLGIPVGRLLLESIDLRRSQVHHVIVTYSIHLRAGGGYGLQYIAQFQAELGSLVPDVVVSLFQLREGEFFLLPSGIRP